MCLHMRKRVNMLASHRGRSIAAAVRREDAAFAELRARDNEVLEESKVTHPPGVRVYRQSTRRECRLYPLARTTVRRTAPLLEAFASHGIRACMCVFTRNTHQHGCARTSS